MKKLAWVAIAMLLAACGSNDSSTSDSTKASKKTQPAPVESKSHVLVRINQQTGNAEYALTSTKVTAVDELQNVTNWTNVESSSMIENQSELNQTNPGLYFLNGQEALKHVQEGKTQTRGDLLSGSESSYYYPYYYNHYYPNNYYTYPYNWNWYRPTYYYNYAYWYYSPSCYYSWGYYNYYCYNYWW